MSDEPPATSVGPDVAFDQTLVDGDAAAQLLALVAPEHREEVAALQAALARAAGPHESDELDGFAHVLHQRGLLSADALKEFLTYHGLTVGDVEAAIAESVPGRYEVKTLVGHGAMGEVFLGRDPGLCRTVAVKRVHVGKGGDPVLLRRFLTEAQVTAQLDHPAIVPVYGLDRDAEGKLAYAMKFVRGVTLTDYFEATREMIAARGAPDAAHSLRARVELLLPVLNAIAYAHRRGVVHRDLKPDNIMVGSFGQVLVMDWGIARLLGEGDPDATSPPVAPDDAPDDAIDDAIGDAPPLGRGGTHPKLTVAGSILGTPAYMSPEQAAGEAVGPASDQYTLGLILQEIVTLAPAIKAESLALLLVRAQRGLREPISEAAGKVPRELAAIIARATAPEATRRYPSVAAFADDLRRFLRDESVEADPDRGLRRVKRWIGKHRGLAMGLVAALVLLAFAIVVVLVWQSQIGMAEARDAARRHQGALFSLGALVEQQARRMSDRLHRSEALLEGITSAASIILTEPAPTSSEVVYQYREGTRDPPSLPAYLVESRAYGQPSSLRGDLSAAWGVDRAALRWRADQLVRMAPHLRSALLASAGDEALALPFAEAERLVLERGVPLVWSYLYTEDGLGLGMPGTWQSYDSPGGVGYDHRREDWYRQALGTRGPRWTASSDASEVGLTMSCLAAVRDGKGAVIGVAGVDIWLDRFVDELLDIPALAAAGAEAVLLDAEGLALIRSSDKDKAKTLINRAPAPYEDTAVAALVREASEGQRELADGRLAIWTRLASAGLTYLIVGPAAPMLGAARAEPDAP